MKKPWWGIPEAERKAASAKRRARVNELLNEIGQDDPPCGFDINDGWFEPVAAALRKMAKVGIQWKLEQVKQKFTQLRIYISMPTPDVTPENHDSATNPWIWEDGHPLKPKHDEIYACIAEAAVACDSRCELCGSPAEPGAGCGTKLCDVCRGPEGE